MAGPIVVTIVGAYCVVAGAAVAAWWAAEKRKPAARRMLGTVVRSHIVAEILTAAVLIVGGASLGAGLQYGGEIAIFGLGMLVYATVNASGSISGAGNRKLVYALEGEAALSGLAILALLVAG